MDFIKAMDRDLNCGIVLINREEFQRTFKKYDYGGVILFRHNFQKDYDCI